MSTDLARMTGGLGPRRAALVVAASPVLRQLLSLLLAPRFDVVVAHADGSGVLEALRDDGPFDLLVLDLDAPGDGLGLLEAVQDLPKDRPAILALTRYPNLELETQLPLRGAIGFVAKPIAPPALLRALRSLEGRGLAASPARALLSQGDVSAEVLDPASGDVLLRWEVRDISRSGALLISHGPGVVGQLLQLRLRLGSDCVETAAEVVRVQEPAWGLVPGIAVRFLEIDEPMGHLLDRFVAGWGIMR